MPQLRRGRSAALLLALLLAVGGLTLAAPASAVPPECDPVADPECFDPPDFYSFDSTLTVNLASGMVSSDPAGISRPGDCSQTDTQTTVDDPTRPTTDWTTYTLTAGGGPPGYTARWTNCTQTSSYSCTVTNNQETKTVSMTWVDTTGPTVTLISPTADQKVGATMVATAIASDNAHVARVDFLVDGAVKATDTSAPYSADIPMSGYADKSTHTVAAKATDTSGRFAQTGTRSVTVDRSTSLVVGDLPALTNAATPVALAVTPADDATATCRFDGGPATDCTDGYTLPVDASTPDGTHTVQVTATDDLGNTASRSATTVLDRTAPKVAFTQAPGAGSSIQGSSTTITFTQVDAHPGTASCTFDGVATPCTSGQPTTLPLPSGFHAFTVTATDGAGNRSTATRSFTSTLPPTQAPVTGGTETGVHESITRAPTRLHAKATKRKVLKGRRATLVANGLPEDATGTVVFRKGKKKLCTAKVKNGKARCRTRKLGKAGRYRVKAHYRGSTAYRPSTDRFSFRVRRAG